MADGKQVNLMMGDCIDRMKEIEDGSVDVVLTDPPYGTTACKWDAVIPFDHMWKELKRILRPDGAAIFTASQPFTSALVMSNVRDFAHEWVWNKRFAANFVQAKRQPLKDHENVLVFGMNGKQPRYFPEMVARETPIKKGGNKPSSAIPIRQTEAAVAFSGIAKEYSDKNPTSATSLSFSSREGRGLHPTQKPVALMEYLIRTYSNERETILDFTMGSGTTGVACVNTGRNFIGIERDEGYFQISKDRIEAAQNEKSMRLF